MLADKEGHVALVEIFDNHRAICQIDNNSRQGYIAATNHIHLPELRQLEPWAMQNSVCRLETIKKSLQHKTEVSADFIKALLLREYPNGLKVSHYQCSFGTIKSMIFNLEECSVEICWGGVSDNHWKRYSLNTSTPNEQFKQVIIDKPPSDAFFELIAL